MTEGIKKFDWPTRKSINQIRFDPASGKAHKLKVLDICRKLIEDDIPFLTRARLETNTLKERLVADIVDLKWNNVIEVQDSESDESIERKKKIWKKHEFDLYVERIETD